MKRPPLLPCLILAGFLLGIRDGRIALWKENQATPSRIFSTQPDMLPVADQLALRRGIVLDSETELAHMLEDYLS